MRTDDGRDVKNPIVRTYFARGTSRSGRSIVRARVYSRIHGVDRRGTDSTVEKAVAKAMRGLKRPGRGSVGE